MVYLAPIHCEPTALWIEKAKSSAVKPTAAFQITLGGNIHIFLRQEKSFKICRKSTESLSSVFSTSRIAGTICRSGFRPNYLLVFSNARQAFSAISFIRRVRNLYFTICPGPITVFAALHSRCSWDCSAVAQALGRGGVLIGDHEYTLQQSCFSRSCGESSITRIGKQSYTSSNVTLFSSSCSRWNGCFWGRELSRIYTAGVQLVFDKAG